MTWTSIWPIGTDSVKDNKLPGQNNTAYIETTFAKVNHYFNESNAGKHRFVTLPVQASNPAALAAEGTLFTKLVVSSGNNELFYRYGNTGNVFRLTENGAVVGANATDSGASSLVGTDARGLKIQWGTESKNTGGTVTFAAAYSIAPYCIQITPLVNDTSRIYIWVMTRSTTGFTVAVRDRNGNDDTLQFTWLAIGAA